MAEELCHLNPEGSQQSGQGLGFRIWGLRGSGFRVQGLEFRVWGFWVWGWGPLNKDYRLLGSVLGSPYCV